MYDNHGAGNDAITIGRFVGDSKTSGSLGKEDEASQAIYPQTSATAGSSVNVAGVKALFEGTFAAMCHVPLGRLSVVFNFKTSWILDQKLSHTQISPDPTR